MALSPEEFCAKIRAVLKDDKKLDEIIDQLGATDLIPLLVKFKGIEKIEGDELKTKLRGKLGRERNRTVISRIMKKDTLASYKALSQVIEYKNKYTWTTFFPFAKGFHGSLTVQPLSPPSRPLIQPAADQPDIIWLCADYNVFQLASRSYCKSDVPLKSMMSGTIKYCELPLINDYDVRVWVCFPDVAGKIDFYNFYQTYCRSKCCIYTGNCTVMNTSDYQLGDICVSKKAGSCMTGFSAILEHDTAENETDGLLCNNINHSVKPIVAFGEVGHDVSDNKIDFVSVHGSVFCTKSEDAYKKGAKIDHAAILVATKDSLGCTSEVCACGEKNINHAIDFSHKLIVQLVNRITISKCRSGRNPSL